ncbi:MAG: ATP-binding protein [Deferribacterales bacterium]
MSDKEGKVDFSFGWLALKLLGKNLYSNAWSAISELVANGFDARASEIYVYIDASNKENSIIEILDNGNGMGLDEINTYVKVGYNKRKDVENDDVRNSLMGRKGIGKLAALYLSENYYLFTKSTTQTSIWEMKYNENPENEEEKPSLEEVESDIIPDCNVVWKNLETGTLLRMLNVDLTGVGAATFKSLEYKLSNHFSLEAMGDKKIYLFVKDSINQVVTKEKFKVIEKHVAFKNFAYINYALNSNKDESLKSTIKALPKGVVKIPFSSKDDKGIYEHKCELAEFKKPSKGNFGISGSIKHVNDDGEVIEKTYELSGWIGIHSTINNNAAKDNDDNFNKNKAYNPNQIRLYVRNKLAIENFLNIIQNTQAFVNYIEGDIHFDILDDDDFPDIATSNRQGLDENDERVKLLISLVESNIQDLINKRNELAERIKDLKKARQDSAKKQFAKELDKELGGLASITKSEKAQLQLAVVNKIKGDVTPKDEYIIFVSHSSADSIFTNFIYDLLLSKGADPREFFYTSAKDSNKKYEDLTPLDQQMKENITNQNALIFYLPSINYMRSEYCMFEGGAGWATRGVGEYLMLPMKYSDLPKLLTNGKGEFSLIKSIDEKNNIDLGREEYQYIVSVLNRMIEHLNSGREINDKTLIPKFPDAHIPNKFELEQTGKVERDFMDTSIVSYWDCYVTSEVSQYLTNYVKVSGKTKSYT